MKVTNMTSSKGNTIPNQFIIEDGDTIYFQSYRTIIAKKHLGLITLDNKWDYSKTTGKYRNQFLGETTKETQAKIDAGIYIVTNLNS